MSIEELIERGRTAWPGVEVARDALVEHLQRFDGADAHVEDLYLAAACLQGNTAALRAFENTFADELARAAKRGAAHGLDTDDLRQRVHILLFTTPAKIGEYAGRSSLRSWLRTVLARLVVDHVRTKSGREQVVKNEQTVDALAERADDPELAYLKQRYGREVARAFEQAFAELPAEHRNALRHRYVEQLSIDQIAIAHGIHRASAARRVQKAEQALHTSTRAKLESQLKMSGTELASVLRLVQSELHVSVVRLLA